VLHYLITRDFAGSGYRSQSKYRPERTLQPIRRDSRHTLPSDRQQYLAVNGPEDPRYPHLLRAFLIGNQSKQFQVLWDALFTQNEQTLSELVYLKSCQDFLAAFSADAPPNSA